MNRPDAPSGDDPRGPLTAQEWDTYLVHEARTRALYHLTYAHRDPDGVRMAWEACASLAEALLPMANPAFKEGYLRLTRDRSQGDVKPRALWRFCSDEMMRQGRLGRERPPLSKQRFGVEAIKNPRGNPLAE